MPAQPAEVSLADIASQHRIPLFQVDDMRGGDLLDLVRSLSPGLIVVSCFPYRLPASLLAAALHGGINLHPSLLPKHRGPDPLFWTYRLGDRQSGVTIHRLTEALDAGPIVARVPIPLPRGLPGDEFERRCARKGGLSLVKCIATAMQDDDAGRPQSDTEATYEGWPDDADLFISERWPVEQAYHFARGVIPLGYHPLIDPDATRRQLIAVDSVEPGTTQAEPVRYAGELARIRCADGVLVGRIAINSA